MEIEKMFLMCSGERLFAGDRVSIPKYGRVIINSIDYSNMEIKVSNEYINVTLKHSEFPEYLFFTIKVG